MTDNQQREAARQFFYKWQGRGKEDEDARSYWIDVLQDLFGVEHVTDRVEFEKKVTSPIGSTNRIDVYIPETRVLIEQKSLGIPLDKPQAGHGGKTPYEQAKEYDNYLPYDERARWIITSNFVEIWIYDMNARKPEPLKLQLSDLQTKYPLLEFLVKKNVKKVTDEMRLSIQAGELVGKIHDRFLEQYNDPLAKHTQRSLNILCVRLVFCLFAEDAGLFASKNAFEQYIEQYRSQDLRRALIDLFTVLNTPDDQRADMYLPDDLAAFPYVNGGLFAEENIVIPRITDTIKDTLIESSHFNWADISPTIFGAVFESTLNPETRRSGGMHYTSIENIHKVIDPLFLDDLKAELEEIKTIQVPATLRKRCDAYQDKLALLTFLDPACGSGNFLTETFLSIRRLENEAIKLRVAAERKQVAGQMTFGMEGVNPVRVSISQFYGIEINDFAVRVAQAALWIAESQMLKETEDIVYDKIDFLPLKTNANIIEQNALRYDWAKLISPEKLSYIMGNPPFVGQAMRTKEQAADMQDVFAPSKAGGKLDYVAGWFKKASDYMLGTPVCTAFVSSNSICQGESVNLLWELLFSEGIKIQFAHTTFVWTSEAKDNAAVMCVIVGFSFKDRANKRLYTNGSYKTVDHINGYLNPAPDVFIKNRSKSINEGSVKVVQGSPPADDGKLLLSAAERNDFLSRYPELEEVIRPFVGSREFINDVGFSRYCFWFADKSPANYQHIPELLERFNYIREYRLRSPVDRIQKTANKPYLFTQNRQPKTDYLIIPRVSSSSRRYIPVGFLPPEVIASDAAVVVNNATLYEFGVICSNVHNSWMRTVAGRLKNDYRYAPSVYYNFPFPNPSDEQRRMIMQTAQGILDARKLYPDKSLADMYGDAMYLYPELQKAHTINDIAVMRTYGMPIRETTEADCVAWLMRLYQELVQESQERK